MRMLTAVVCALLVLVWAISAPACDVDLIDVDSFTWYLYSDPCIDGAEVWWEPDVRPDKRRYREDIGAYALSVQHGATFPVVWRLESGDVDAFDWSLVEEKLAAVHNLRIGEVRDCVVCGVIAPTECYRTVVEVFPAYQRRLYRVTQGEAVAWVAVLVPHDGMALVYRDAEALEYHACGGAPAPESAIGTCGSVSTTPEPGLSCRDGSGGTNKFWRRDTPVLTQPAAEALTWGAVKARYGGK